MVILKSLSALWQCCQSQMRQHRSLAASLCRWAAARAARSPPACPTMPPVRRSHWTRSACGLSRHLRSSTAGGASAARCALCALQQGASAGSYACTCSCCEPMDVRLTLLHSRYAFAARTHFAHRLILSLRTRQVRAALHATRVPKVSVSSTSTDGVDGADGSGSGGSGGGGNLAPLDLDLDESLDDSTPFEAAGLPLYLTLASLGGVFVADCTAKERRAAGSTLSLALDGQGNVCALTAGGGFGLHLAAHSSAMVEATKLGMQLHAAATAAIAEAEEAAERRGGAAGAVTLSSAFG